MSARHCYDWTARQARTLSSKRAATRAPGAQWSSGRQPALQKAEDTPLVDGSALGADVAVLGARDDGQLARIVTMGVKPLHIVRRCVRVFAAGDQQHRHRRQPADVIDRCELGQADAETPLGDPDDAAAEAMEPRRITA